MRLKSVLSAVGIAAVLVVGADYVSFAATGQSAILGKVNKANQATTFERTTNGPAVAFKTKPGKVPFTVNRPVKVTNLNADKLDGRDSTSFATNNPTRVYRYKAEASSTAQSFSIPIPASGQYLLTYSVPTTLAGASNQWISCEIGQQNTLPFGTYQASGRATSFTGVGNSDNGPALAVSATTVVNPQGYPALFNLYCNASSAWTTPPTFSFIGTNLYQPVTITLSKISNVTISNKSADSNERSTSRQAARTR